jgi:allophanate hydrolase subunit 2
LWDNPTPLQQTIGGSEMQNLKRNIQMKFRVTEEERKLIEQKMAQLPTKQIGAYLRKMAIDGYIIYTDTSNIKEFTKELQAIGRNVYQITKRANFTGTVYDEDIAEIKERLNEIWQLQRRILLSLH